MKVSKKDEIYCIGHCMGKEAEIKTFSNENDPDMNNGTTAKIHRVGILPKETQKKGQTS